MEDAIYIMIFNTPYGFYLILTLRKIYFGESQNILKNIIFNPPILED